MTISILTVGTRGDIQPYLALAVGLKAQGHQVRLATGSNFEGWVREWGIEFFGLRANFQTLIESEDGKKALSNPLGSGRFVRETVGPMFAEMLEDSWQAVQGSQAIVYHPKVFSGPHIAERLGLSAAIAATVPVITPTGDFAMPGLFNRSLGTGLNRATFGLSALSLALFNGVLHNWRQSIGLSAKPTKNGLRYAGTRQLPVLYNYSPLVVPAPSDWDADNHVLGYWNLPPKPYRPDAKLEQFLAAGPPPVYVGFGSMAGLKPEATTQIVIAALQQAGLRGVLATGWGGMKTTQVPENVLLLESVPHEWLFPRVSAVVHHGGAGTTGTGLTAGKPTLICPFSADQPFWGKRVHDLGVGVAPIPQKNLNVEKLTSALRQITQDLSMRQKAEALGQQLRAEDGVGNAVRWIEQRWAREPISK